MSRMFLIPINGELRPMRTWNCFVGCDYFCTYCNARQLALTRLQNSPRYQDGFKPHLVESELSRRFKPGEFIFVGYMGDISFASRDEAYCILSIIRKFPQTDFLLCSKNPACFFDWDLNIPPNVFPGTTIETNWDLGLSKSPAPLHRYKAMRALGHQKKFISIEPICDFDLGEMLTWMEEIKPEIVEVGADNYHNNLPEPKWYKVKSLLHGLRNFCPTVIEKSGLHRLERR